MLKIVLKSGQRMDELTSRRVNKLTSWLYAEVGCSFSPHVVRNVVKSLEDYVFFTKFAPSARNSVEEHFVPSTHRGTIADWPMGQGAFGKSIISI